MSKNKKTIALNGALGRMGTAISDLCKTKKDFQISYAFEYPNHPRIGKELYSEKEKKKFSLKKVLIEEQKKDFEVDFIVDFSTPDSAINLARIASKLKIPFVTGTTGFTRSQMRTLKMLSKKIPILQSYNMSVGINVLLKILIQNIEYFESTDLEITETHHKKKIDSPSGTAILMADTIRKSSKKKADININSIRKGSAVGEHTLISFGDQENIYITHEALDRSIFATGALVMGNKITRKRNGFYTILDLLE
ncbi:MAG: 4-hydroxy-tetrahydrodipicolinate reductase [Thermodesulfobacteriota bacterium]|nr:4-hydroxy-tetrahydrodipicolinate reductase [Thermodesulfobacteriota bacterium]MEE2975341.1 4-hydroxy-tetrahydrodipicolinate reductase [Thermodesulfobacteriota bacterium]